MLGFLGCLVGRWPVDPKGKEQRALLRCSGKPGGPFPPTPGCLERYPHLLTGRPQGSCSLTPSSAAWSEPGAKASLTPPTPQCCDHAVLL